MSDTPEEIAARALDERYPPLAEDHTMTADEWRRAYFALAEIANGQIDKAYAHIDALTAAVEALTGVECFDEPGWEGNERLVYRAAVLAILRGEQVDPDAEAEAEFLKPIKPQGL